MKLKLKLVLAAGVSALALAGAMNTPAEAKELIFSIIGTPKHISNFGPNGGGVLATWNKDVQRETKGDLKFKIPLTPLAPPPRLYDATKSGITDAAVQFNAFLQKRVPSVQMSLLPLLFTRSDAHGVALWRTYNKFFAKGNEYKEVQLLGFFSLVGGTMCSLKDKPIDSVATLRSMKMWSLPGFAAKSMAALKVNVTPGPAVRIFPIVSKGVVDGYNALIPGDSYSFNINRYTKSCTTVEGGTFTPTFSVVMNKKAWGALSRATKDGLMRASGENLARRGKIAHDQALKQEKRFQADGKKLIAASPKFAAALRKAWQPLHDQWIATANKAGFDGKGAYDFFRAESKKLAAEYSK